MDDKKNILIGQSEETITLFDLENLIKLQLIKQSDGNINIKFLNNLYNNNCKNLTPFFNFCFEKNENIYRAFFNLVEQLEKKHKNNTDLQISAVDSKCCAIINSDQGQTDNILQIILSEKCVSLYLLNDNSNNNFLIQSNYQNSLIPEFTFFYECLSRLSNLTFDDCQILFAQTYTNKTFTKKYKIL